MSYSRQHLSFKNSALIFTPSIFPVPEYGKTYSPLTILREPPDSTMLPGPYPSTFIPSATNSVATYRPAAYVTFSQFNEQFSTLCAFRPDTVIDPHPTLLFDAIPVKMLLGTLPSLPLFLTIHSLHTPRPLPRHHPFHPPSHHRNLTTSFEQFHGDFQSLPHRYIPSTPVCFPHIHRYLSYFLSIHVIMISSLIIRTPQSNQTLLKLLCDPLSYIFQLRCKQEHVAKPCFLPCYLSL